MRAKQLTTALVLSVLGVTAIAETDEVKIWTVKAELGALNTSGNTEGTSVNGRLTAKQELERWHNEYEATALYKKDRVTLADGTRASEVSAERYFASVKSAYQLTGEYGNLFVFGSHAHDEFGAYRKYTTASAGYGLRVIDRDSVTLDAEIGPGYFWGDKVLSDAVIEKEEGAMLRAAADFLWQITENASFNQKLGADAAEDNIRYVSDTSVSTKISDRMQMRVGYSLAHNTEVAPGKERTDSTSYVNVVYTF